MRIDCYGERTESPTYEKKRARQPLETKDSGGCSYMRFGNGEVIPIHRLKVGDDGAVRHDWALGAWADAENLDYIPITETMEVDG